MMMSLRVRYEQAVRDLRERADEMLRAGASSETVARTMHTERRRLASVFKELTPEPHRTLIYERTRRVYGSELGPTIEFLRAQGKSWEAIIESATRPGLPVELGKDQANAEVR